MLETIGLIGNWFTLSFNFNFNFQIVLDSYYYSESRIWLITEKISILDSKRVLLNSEKNTNRFITNNSSLQQLYSNKKQ